MAVLCNQHPKYTAKRRPRTACAKCRMVYYAAQTLRAHYNRYLNAEIDWAYVATDTRIDPCVTIYMGFKSE
jgi:hypothetical protein